MKLTMAGGHHIWGAATYGDEHVVSYLIINGANIEATENDTGSPPLVVACQEGKLETAKVLIKAGANVIRPRKDGSTCAFMAAKNNRLDVLKFIIGDNQGVFNELLNEAENGRRAPLWVAALHGHEDVVSYLIIKGAIIEAAENTTGSAPLIAACQQGKLGSVKILTEAGVNVTRPRKDRSTCALMAAKNNHLNVFRFII